MNSKTRFTVSNHSLFPIRHRTVNPEAIVLRKSMIRQSEYTTGELRGTFYRVFPSSAREILALQMLEHHQEKHAPAHGDGVLVTAEALAKFE